MKQTSVPGRNTAQWALDRGHLFFGQFSDFHPKDFAIKAAVKLFTLGHFRYFPGTLYGTSAGGWTKSCSKA